MPADNKWYTRVAVISAIIQTLQALELRYPVVTEKLHRQIEEARAVLADKDA